MMTRSWIIALLCILCTGTLASSGDLSVEDCVQLGLERNQQLLSLTAELAIEEAQSKITLADHFPTLQLEGSYLMRDQPPTFTIESGIFGPGMPAQDTDIEGDEDHYTVGLTLKQPLFAGGRIVSAHARQRLITESKRHRVESQRNLLVYQIRSVFYRALTLQHEMSSSAKLVSARQEGLRIMKALHSEGKAPNDEILQAQADLMFAEAAKLRAEQSYQNVLDELSSLIGNDDPGFSITSPTNYATLAPDYNFDPVAVLDNREELRQLDSNIGAAEKHLSVAQSGYYPALSAEASYLKQKETDITEPEIWAAGLRLEWPLFEAGKTNAEVAKAKAEKLRLQHLRSDLTRSLLNEVKSAIRQVRESEISVAAHQLQLQTREQQARHTVERYHNGKALWRDLIDSQRELLAADAAYHQAINALRTAIAGLEKAEGTPIGSHLVSREIYRPDLTLLSTSLSPQATGGIATPSQIVPPSPQPRPPQAGTASYLLQLGAFKSKAGARLLLKQLQKQHPEKSFEVVPTGGWHKIRVAQRYSRQEAMTALQEFKGKGIVLRAAGHR